jgi:hypothetical protein
MFGLLSATIIGFTVFDGDSTMFHATVLPQKYQYFLKVYIYFYVIYNAHSPVTLNIL